MNPLFGSGAEAALLVNPVKPNTASGVRNKTDRISFNTENAGIRLGRQSDLLV